MREIKPDENILEALASGRQTFMGLELEVGPGALVPRHDTEALGKTMLAAVRDMISNSEAPKNPILIDLCCGVGNLGCALAVHLPEARVYLADLLVTSTALAQRNVERLGIQDRVTVLQGDLFQPLEGLGLEGRVTAIVCNPPYISSRKLEQERHEIVEHEPREAFDGGPYGLTIHQRVCREAHRWLQPGGWLMFECGAGQGRQVSMLFDRTRQFGPAQVIEPEPGAAGVAGARIKAEGANSSATASAD